MYELKDVEKRFQQGGTAIVAAADVTLEIAAGEMLAIEGPSGSGKTTLLQLLGGLDRPTSGQVLFEGRDLAALADRALAEVRLNAIGFVFQQFNLIPTLTARENVEAALAPNGMPGADRRARALDKLEQVGLAARADHVPSKLSGGEQQRVAIARALANEPRVILADEPTGNLDSESGRAILAILTSLSRDLGKTVIVVTHDAAAAGQAERVLHMRDGKLVEKDGPATGSQRQV